MTLARYAFEPLIPEPQQAALEIAALQSSAATIEVVAAPPPPPSFSEAEMEAARKAAYEEGFMAGKAEGKREADAQMMQLQQEANQVSQMITQRLDNLAQQHRTYLIEKQAELGRLVLACAQKIAVEALRKDPLADIQAMVDDCLAQLMEQPMAVIQVHPKLQPQLAGIYANRAKVMGNPEIKPLDCVIQWQYGEATREIDEIWNQIEETIERYFTISAQQMTQESTNENPQTEDENNG
jgi:flagellar assembly protein FliH